MNVLSFAGFMVHLIISSDSSNTWKDDYCHETVETFVRFSLIGMMALFGEAFIPMTIHQIVL